MVVSKQEYITYSLLAVVITMSLMVVTNNKRTYSVSLEPLDPISTPLPTPLPTPTPAPLLNIMQISPNGSHEVQIKAHNDNYQLTFTRQEENTKHLLYSLPIEKNKTPALPFNSWAPDHKYVFIKVLTESNLEYLVFPVTDKQVEEPVLVVELFNQKYPDLTVVDVTGWAAPNLLIVNTTTSNGEIGPSFWFNPATKSITQLSTLFL